MNGNTTEILIGKIVQIEWMFFDVDGILTDGGLFYGEKGETFKRFNVLDGYGIKKLIHGGVSVGLISSRDHPSTKIRAKELGDWIRGCYGAVAAPVASAAEHFVLLFVVRGDTRSRFVEVELKVATASIVNL